jgi:lipoprotein signal peptidase
VAALELSGLTQAIVSTVLLVGMLVLYLHRFARSRWWLLLAVGICACDQAIKAFVLPALSLRQVSLLGGVVHLSYVENREQGFGGNLSYLLLVTLVCVAALAFLYDRLARTNYRMSGLAQVGFALMVGGYLGILTDRVALDFIELGRAGHFVYNIADLAVFAAIAVLIVRAAQYLSDPITRRKRLLDDVL